MFQPIWMHLSEIITEQFGYLQKFGEEVRAGNLSASQISARSELYMETTTRSHEQAKAASYGIELPEYPRTVTKIVRHGAGAGGRSKRQKTRLRLTGC